VRIRFGPFIVDADTRQLLRGDAECHLPPKAYDLLWTLIERRRKVVEKTELHERIWPNTFVVEGSLNVLVGQIRRALDDDPRRPRYIRTVHGIGYAFCGEAVEVAEEAARIGSTRCWLVRGDRTFGLAEGDNVIGRDPECAVWLNSASVSRRHASINVDSRRRRLELEDLGSSNGTYVGGALVERPVELSDGDAIRFGTVDLKLQLWNADTASKTRRIARKGR
jgi:DNA-binding winged helix-turn-helix (wHTH) protein